MTVIRPNSISGVTSITAQGDTLTLYKSDGTNIGQLDVNIYASSGVSTIANLNVIGGSVGIGTDNPVSKLAIVGSSGDDARLEIKRTTSNVSGYVGAVNFTALDGHSVASVSALGDGDNEGAHLIFRTTSAAGENSPFGGNTFERLRITSTGNVDITNGNLVFSTSGTGIDFSATADGSGTTTSELLDDYEEGTWTPTYQALTTNFTSVTYAQQIGWYTKVGNTVHAFFYMYTNSVAGGSGNVVITGLPFLTGNAATMPLWQAKWDGNYPYATRSPGSTIYGILYKTNSTGVIQATDLGTGSNQNQVEGFIVYQV